MNDKMDHKAMAHSEAAGRDFSDVIANDTPAAATSSQVICGEDHSAVQKKLQTAEGVQRGRARTREPRPQEAIDELLVATDKVASALSTSLEACDALEKRLEILEEALFTERVEKKDAFKANINYWKENAALYESMEKDKGRYNREIYLLKEQKAELEEDVRISWLENKTLREEIDGLREQLQASEQQNTSPEGQMTKYDGGSAKKQQTIDIDGMIATEVNRYNGLLKENDELRLRNKWLEDTTELLDFAKTIAEENVRLKATIQELESAQARRASLVNIGTAIRKRFWVLAKAKLDNTPTDTKGEAIIATADSIAHQPDVLADVELFRGNILSATSDESTFNNLYKSTIHLDVDYSLFPSYCKMLNSQALIRLSIPDDCQLRKSMLWDQREEIMLDLWAIWEAVEGSTEFETHPEVATKLAEMNVLTDSLLAMDV